MKKSGLTYLLSLFFIFFLLSLSSEVYTQHIVFMNESQAKAALAEGGVYEANSRVEQPPGWWVQYRKVLKITHVSTDPATGQKGYHVYYSDVIPSPGNVNNHDPSYLSDNKYWLWVPEGTTIAPWRWTTQQASQWTLKAGFPKMNPDNVPLTKATATTHEECKIYGQGSGTYYWSGNKQTGVSDAEWYFRHTYQAQFPNTLNPGDKVYLQLHADASGQKMNYHIGHTLELYASGFNIQCDPPTGSYRRPQVFAGRAGNGTLVLKDDRNCMLTVPDNPQNTLSLSFYLGGWGTLVTYIWEENVGL